MTVWTILTALVPTPALGEEFAGHLLEVRRMSRRCRGTAVYLYPYALSETFAIAGAFALAFAFAFAFSLCLYLCLCLFRCLCRLAC